MSSWSLEAFIDAGDPLDVEVIARRIGDFSKSEGVVGEHLCPFNDDRLGIRIDWQGWWIIVIARHGPDVISDAIMISTSRATPAEARRRLKNCSRSVRVIFGPDDARRFTNTIIDIGDYLNSISQNRTYDPRRNRFWPSSK